MTFSCNVHGLGSRELRGALCHQPVGVGNKDILVFPSTVKRKRRDSVHGGGGTEKMPA